MSIKPKEESVREETAVDDVWRVREELCAEAGNDVRRLAEIVSQRAKPIIEKLGLKVYRG